MNEEVKLYLLFAFAGAVAGFIRFMETKRKFGWRVVLTSCLLGSLISTFVIAWWFDGLVLSKPIKCTTLSAMIGYIQPNVVRLVEIILKIKLSDKDGE